MRLIALTVGCLLGSSAATGCWEAVAQRYALSASLLKAIALTESNMNPRALNTNRNGSRDIGLMQINSWWLPHLARHGIGEHELWDPCTNIVVGAWILAQEFARHGPGWEAVGAYHSPTPAHRAVYIDKVRAQLHRLETTHRPRNTPVPTALHQP